VSERAAPFYCPYCGEQDIRPFGEDHGGWRCGSCLRAFRLSYRGLTRSPAAATAATTNEER
jgi:hypothetical protein